MILTTHIRKKIVLSAADSLQYCCNTSNKIYVHCMHVFFKWQHTFTTFTTFQSFLTRCSCSDLPKDYVLPLSNADLRGKAVVKLTLEEVFSNVVRVTVCAQRRGTGTYHLTVNIDKEELVSIDIQCNIDIVVLTYCAMPNCQYCPRQALAC